MSIYIIILIIIVLAIIFEGFFSGSELALVSLNKFLLVEKVKQGSKRAKLVMRFLEKPTEFISTTLLGTGLCIVLSSTLATFAVIRLFGIKNAYIAPLVVSPLVLIFGELIPKNIGQRFADKFSLRAIIFLIISKAVFYPFIKFFSAYTTFLSNRLGLDDASQPFVPSREQLRVMLHNAGEGTDFLEHEKEMADKVLALSEIVTEEAMTPLIKVDVLSITSKVTEAVKLINVEGHSRIPLFEGRVDNIVKMLYGYDLLYARSKDDEIKEYAKEALYVSAGTPLDDLMQLLRNKATHMAIVVDEFGAAIGVITMEDIIEEIIGDVKDEFDDQETLFYKLTDKLFLVNASIELNMLNEALKLDIHSEEYTTLSGYLLELFEKIPRQGEKINDGHNEYIISKASKRMIEEVIIKVRDKKRSAHHA